MRLYTEIIYCENKQKGWIASKSQTNLSNYEVLYHGRLNEFMQISSPHFEHLSTNTRGL